MYFSGEQKKNANKGATNKNIKTQKKRKRKPKSMEIVGSFIVFSFFLGDYVVCVFVIGPRFTPALSLQALHIARLWRGNAKNCVRYKSTKWREKKTNRRQLLRCSMTHLDPLQIFSPFVLHWIIIISSDSINLLSLSLMCAQRLLE